LVLADLTESDSTGTVTVGLLYTPGGGSRFAGGLGGKLLTWGLASGGFACGLLGAVIYYRCEGVGVFKEEEGGEGDGGVRKRRCCK